MDEQTIIQFFSQYAYEPTTVYMFVILFMTASSFGFPVPEEVTLVGSGLIAFMARNPDMFPPPYPGAEGVNLVLLSIICFLSVIVSDILVYSIGKFFGNKLQKTNFFKKRIKQERFDKINGWFQKYSFFAPAIFRFTPGIRFPGHMSCGMMEIPFWKFILVDGVAALISVPTQVLVVAFYGEIIIEKLREFKLILFSVIGLLILIFIIKKYLSKRKEKKKGKTVDESNS